MKLSAGGYKLRGTSQDGKIHVRWQAEDSDAVRVSLEVKGGEAWLQAKGPHDNFQVEIDLPRRTDIAIRLSVGELDIQGIEGHKDLACRVGEISVAEQKADLRSAEAGVKIGGLHVFGTERGGFFRSERWRGTGAYDLLAKVGTGEVRLFAADPPSSDLNTPRLQPPPESCRGTAGTAW